MGILELANFFTPLIACFILPQHVDDVKTVTVGHQPRIIASMVNATLENLLLNILYTIVFFSL